MNDRGDKQHVFIVGSKGIPGKYGGYETFVDKLTEYHQCNTDIQYHVACKSDNDDEFQYHNARCFNVKVPNIGSGQAILYDIWAINKCLQYIKLNDIKNPIVYILACRIGPFARRIQKKLHDLGGRMYINPDGHEWLREKWPIPVRKYWKTSEKLMVKYADMVICDSENIEKYIINEYLDYGPETTFIPYGAETRSSALEDDNLKVTKWLNEHSLERDNFYLVVGRFVPENNYETMIKEFMKSDSKRSFALITNVSEKFLEKLKVNTGFEKDSRIKFVGTVYDEELLIKIREFAYGYFHGHEVGGTNPSLLEALGSTKLNLLLDVSFNREVAGEAAVYWNKKERNLAELINTADLMSEEEIKLLGMKSRNRIEKNYNWNLIGNKYKKVFGMGNK